VNCIKDKRIELIDFFSLPIPEKILSYEIEPHNISLQYFENEQVKNLIWEKDRNLYLNNAVKIEIKTRINDEEKKEIKLLAGMMVSEEICKGHFEFFPMLPLAVLAQAMGQVGELMLLTMMNGNCKDTIPLVIKVNEIGMITQKKSRQFIIPNDRLLIVATYKSGKLGLHYVSAEVFLEGNPITRMNDIVYANININKFNIGEKIQ
jgi:3-hydroxymyristoyl/3-hydroxydecanoyl-(acyl carrier protein) dehydratase